MGGLSDGGARYRHLRAGRASKIGEIRICSDRHQKSKKGGNEEKYGAILADFTR